MILKDFLPDSSLREFVQWYRIAHFEFGETGSYLFKAYPPKPEVCLHFLLKGSIDIETTGHTKKETLLSMTLLGQQTGVVFRYMSTSLLNFQVVFQPAAVFRLTGIPALELTNKYLNAEDVFPGTRFLFEELQQAKTYSELLCIADKFLMLIVANPKKDIHQSEAAINLMMKQGGNISLDWLAKESCLCTKQLERKFYERTGVNPKVYARIIRFTKAFNTKNANQDWDWLKIAVECDYFDYQHLVKDYKNFTGLTPGEFHLLESNSPECKAGLAEELYRSRFRLTSCLL